MSDKKIKVEKGTDCFVFKRAKGKKPLLTLNSEGLWRYTPSGWKHLTKSSSILYSWNDILQELTDEILNVLKTESFGNAKYFIPKLNKVRQDLHYWFITLRYGYYEYDDTWDTEEKDKEYQAIITKSRYKVDGPILSCIDILLQHKELSCLETLLECFETMGNYNVLLSSLYSKDLVKGSVKEVKNRVAYIMRIKDDMMTKSLYGDVSYRKVVTRHMNADKLRHPYEFYGRYASYADFEYKGRNKKLMINDSDVSFLLRNGDLIYSWVDEGSLCDIEEVTQRYEDYLDIMNDLHNLEDPYWRHRHNWRDLHDRYAVERLHSYDPQTLEENKALLKNKYSKFDGIEATVGKYTIKTSSDWDVWQTFASELHQCILRASYYNKNTVIVFVFKDGQPYGTCEWSQEEQRVIQQYKDEWAAPGSKGYKLTEEEVKLVEDFCIQNNIKW